MTIAKTRPILEWSERGNKERINALNPRVIDLIECWLDERGRHPSPLFNRIRRGGNITEDSISPQTVYDIIIRRYKDAGVERLTPHDLRRTHVTNFFESGTDIFIVQELMGHSHLNTTKTYDKRSDKKKPFPEKPFHYKFRAIPEYLTPDK